MPRRYRLTGRLGGGELAEMFTALRDERERVVVKLFHTRTSDDDYARAIAATTRKLASLTDDSVLRVTDIGTVKDRLALIRPFVDGFTLGQALQRLLTREVLMAPPVALHALIQLLDSTQHAHDQGVVHGAITPGNILLGKDGRLSIADHGALQALQDAPGLRAFGNKGRGNYRAPELLHGGDATPLSDVFSLGVIAYELITLKDAGPATRTVSTRREPLTPPSRIDRRINARLDPVIMRALDAAPQRRFRSCAEFSSALRAFLSANGGMPSRDALARVVRDLFPNEVQVQVSTEVPFTGAFALTKVEGAAVEAPAATGAQRPRRRDVARAPTTDAIPIIQDPRPREEDPLASETLAAVPTFDPDADERSVAKGDWDAPPGAAPQVRRVGAAAAEDSLSGISLSVKQRVRMVEDFEAPPPPASDTQPEVRQVVAPTPAAAPRPRPVPRRVSTPVAPLEDAPSDPSVPLMHESTGRKRRMFTEELALWRNTARRRRLLLVVLGVASVGALCFGVAVWQLGRSEQAPTRTPVPELVRARPAIEEPAAPSVRPDLAYLTIESNVPAAVYVDGKRVAGTTPLRRHPVQQGERKIVIEAMRTRERRTFSLRFEDGQERKLLEHFVVPGR